MEKKSIENKQTEIHAFVRLFAQLKVQKIPIFFWYYSEVPIFATFIISQV